ncbi:MAG: gamma-glutamyl-gamma-aminobutyrate hydrolase family protein [Flavisolibacter sp.]
MKKIGISYTRTNFQNYWNWFAENLQNGFELIELSFEKNNADDILMCDGFVLTGGVDVNSSLYKGLENYPDKPSAFQEERDAFESRIYEYSQKKQLPLLGVCRGLQLVNVLEGGQLVEDIGKGNSIHKKEEGTDKMHRVIVESGSLLSEITGNTSGVVNSAHHQAAKEKALGKNLKVSAWSEQDHVIEALEFNDKKGKGFMLCIQWHPERMIDKEKNPFSYRIRDRFLEEVKKKI